jgi:DNA (cytosine-5)-methyltransferase 1
MENVPDLLSSKFKNEWHRIYNEIEGLGYKNYVSILNSKDYGIPQNRKRVFMVSILGDYSYEFPNKIDLTIKLRDLLEKEVPNKYWLSQKEIDDEYIPTLTATGEARRNSSMILIKQTPKKDVMPCLTTKAKYGVVIPSKTKKGYEIAEDGDGVYINRPYQKRGTVQKSMIPTLKTSCADIGIVDGYRIRKITPLECWRLMGILDEDFHKAKNAGVSNSQLFKQAGNGIVVNVMEAILKQLF